MTEPNKKKITEFDDAELPKPPRRQISDEELEALMAEVLRILNPSHDWG